MIFLNMGVLIIVALGVWWLTGIDKTASGESKRERYFFRALRCIATLFLVAIFLWFIEDKTGGYGGVPLLLILPVSIALILRSSIAEWFSEGFLRMVDPMLHDHRELDLKQARRHGDNIAHLIQLGKRDEAIKLCKELQESGELDAMTLEATLEFLGVKSEHAPVARPLNQAAQLRAQGKFFEAEQALKSLLVKNPADTGTALMLMRIYAQDVQQPDKAAEILKALEEQAHVKREYIDFARRSIVEWSQPKRKPVAEPVVPESLEEMLAEGFWGTAVEWLEHKIKERPDDLDLRLKLGEVHALYFNNFPRAEKIIRQIETENLFDPAQIMFAVAKLKEWRERRLQPKK